MRTTAVVLTILMAGIANAREPIQHPVSVALGPKAYRDGDVIQITNVISTSDRLEQGDTVTVTGRVRLDSADDAKLCFYLTQTKGDGLEETDATQEVNVKHGVSDFEVTTTIKHLGVLHLSLYRTTTGKPFGGVYFGTSDQMKSLSDASVRHYLQD
ncbi:MULTISPECIES: hypothetical protein [Rhodopirellula]|nr:MULTISPECIES: hypothetical protein [Rhodopirellula]MCC9658804.1 hypothetical protein [Rhodopirellula sp. JC737]